MNKIISKIRKQHPLYLVWIFVIFAIFLNGLFTLTTNVNLKTNVLNHLFQWLLSPFDNIRYGHYLAQKWFLVIIAFTVFIWWLKNKKISFKKTIKKNLLPIGIIAIVTLITHFANYKGWFWIDDFRIMSQYFGPPIDPQIIPCCTTGYYPLGIIYLVIRWFGTNFTLYNTLGTLMIFLVGTAIYFLFNRIQKNKLLSLFLALFFVTVPTYFLASWEMIEWMGDTFSLLLCIISIYLLFSEFWPGVLIFAAAAMEFGLARTHYITLPLTLIAIFFVAKNKSWNKNFIIKLGILCSLPLIYMPVFLNRNDIPHAKSSLAIIAGSIVGVTIPHEIINPIAKLLTTLKVTNIYIVPFIGFSVVLILIITTTLFFFRKKVLSAKLLLIGLSITISSFIFQTIFGTQVNRNVNKMLEYFTHPLPYTTTLYGIMPTFGLVFIVAGFGLAMCFNLFKKLIIIFIILNALTFIRSHLIWNKSFGYPHRKINSQLLITLPSDNLEKYIYVPMQSSTLFNIIRDFRDTFRAQEKYNSVNAPQAFIDLIAKNKPKPNQIYFMVSDKDYNITDLSEKIRENYPNNITLQKLKDI